VTNPAPAVEDTNWLDGAGELYLQAGSSVERDRPIYQGDVFAGVPVIRLPKNPPAGSVVECPIETGAVMVVPHPCQCYYGDRLRPYLTVAPIKIVENYDNFGEDHAGAKDKFALLDLPLPGSSEGSWTAQSCVADLGRMFSVPGRWLKLESRAACLTHEGIGLLAKRVLGFQLRFPSTLAQTMVYTHAEWNESFLMQAWVREHQRLNGFTTWMHQEQVIPGVSQDGELIKPADLRVGAPDILMAMITGNEISEPDSSTD
jgi:hypothetical protein